jgi:hypothetical protein
MRLVGFFLLAYTSALVHPLSPNSKIYTSGIVLMNMLAVRLFWTSIVSVVDGDRTTTRHAATKIGQETEVAISFNEFWKSGGHHPCHRNEFDFSRSRFRNPALF